ncbi:hypothetical protein GCM10010840_30560 [Deinococcus aerolatus]|uniref:Uncharacterized protein n=1 Tax=Deinococcus aerolatus TaxID=522487 RepID=A0ABQ2GEM0_9DEIO|nr:hypothetical protein [Deinococcus aerolatus]GGL90402.1 hypothetical protein GCM10010840_30560 [Deinococcus aerolatus]
MSSDDTSHLSNAATPATNTQRRRARLLRLGLIGMAGALTVTALNEGVRRVLPHAPRIEVIGERALAGSLQALNVDPPRGAALYRWTLLGDLLSNTLYYGLVGLGPRQGAWQRGGLLGLAAGLGAVALPRPLGLGGQPGARSPRTPLLTAAWYLAGGLAAAVAARQLDTNSRGD